MLIVDRRNLIDVIIARGLSCKQLACLSGLGVPAISRLLKADRRCRLETISRLASALGVDHKQFTKERISS